MEGLEKADKAKKKTVFAVMPSFWLLVALCLFLRCFALLGLYTISVLIHEFAHFFVAKKLRYRCFAVRLSVFGAVLYGDFDDVTPADSIKIALAGPMTNLVICCIVVALWWLFPVTYVYLYDFVFCNLALAAINLIPCFPLDGGRILVAALSAKMGIKSALNVSKFLSVVLSCALFVVFLVGILCKQNFFSVGLFAVFLLLGAINDSARTIYLRQTVFDGYKRGAKRGIEKKCLVFDGNCTLLFLTTKLKESYFYEITVLLSNGDSFVLNQLQINDCLLECPLDTMLKDLLKYKR